MNAEVKKQEELQSEAEQEIIIDKPIVTESIVKYNQKSSISELGQLFQGNRRERRKAAKNLKQQLKRNKNEFYTK